ncbi:MAG: enolase C-terminal domain-like protein [Candidatus Latescibacterota bacterium]
MKITDVEVIHFRTVNRSRGAGTRWGYEQWWLCAEESEGTGAITRISTDEGICGHMLGGDKATMEGPIKNMLVGENPLNREKLWHWMDQMSTFGHALAEHQSGVVDCALWDLAGQKADLPVYQLLGGTREQIEAYASTFPNLGGPEVYVDLARDCVARGYKAFKVHANICWDPHIPGPAPQLPGFPREDVEICSAVREAVGDDIVLMLDPFGVYTLEESLWVARELEKLDYYWLEHPMVETRVEAYRRLTRETRIAICSPEHVKGGPFARAEWLLQGACDMLRIDVSYGGITGCWKVINLCQLYGVQCEIHGGGAPHVHLAAATPEATCRYYERGLLRAELDYEVPLSYLNAIPDPIDDEGRVHVSQDPGLGIAYNWDYVDDNRI